MLEVPRHRSIAKSGELAELETRIESREFRSLSAAERLRLVRRAAELRAAVAAEMRGYPAGVELR